MASFVQKKHFLDTTVLRPMLLGVEQYRKYFKTQFNNDHLYVSKYVQMEFKRSYICSILDFYFHLNNPRINTIGDAVIALEAGREMRLECTDYSFDHLCPLIEQPYYRHPSESRFFLPPNNLFHTVCKYHQN